MDDDLHRALCRISELEALLANEQEARRKAEWEVEMLEDKIEELKMRVEVCETREINWS